MVRIANQIPRGAPLAQFVSLLSGLIVSILLTLPISGSQNVKSRVSLNLQAVRDGLTQIAGKRDVWAIELIRSHRNGNAWSYAKWLSQNVINSLNRP